MMVGSRGQSSEPLRDTTPAESEGSGTEEGLLSLHGE